MFRNASVQLGFVVLGVTSVHAVKLLRTSSIHARLFPNGGVQTIWAIQEKDSTRRSHQSINFEIADLGTRMDQDAGRMPLEK